jgi:sigma-B regulation protein RsbU (phosphoserine phosphatase)
VDGLTRDLGVQAHRTTVLLIDDQAMIGEAVRRMLATEADVDYHYWGDPTTALQQAEGLAPTVVLLDLVMPDVDGLTLLRFFRAHPALRDIPIVVLSSKEEATTKAEAFALGASDYLVKLPDPIELVARIKHHSRGYIAQIERNEAFAALELSQKALARELAQAAAYVRSLLPAPVPSGAVTTDWRFIPSVQLGGDSFGYDWLDPEHFAVFLLDVSGHGVKSALLSMTAMNAVRTRTLNVNYYDPASVLGALNDAFQMDQYEGMYFTIWYGVFEPATRRLVFASAGHPPALLLDRHEGQTRVTRVGDAGFTIGMLPGVPFSNNETVVPPAANLLVFSDGAYEITRPDESMWGIDDLAATLATSDPSAGPLPLDGVERTIREIRGVPDFEDDVSILEVRFA